jgi:inhibitor of KinA
MHKTRPYNIYPCGEHAVTIGYGNTIDDDVNAHVLRLFGQLKQQNITGVLDVIPAYSSITVVYDVGVVKKAFPNTTAYNSIAQILNRMEEQPDAVEGIETGNLVRIPVCYDATFGIDLEEVARQKKLSPQTMVQLHTNKTYRVFMLGFLPGFAYMGTVDEQLATPRLSTPRINVKQGSVGIAGKQTGIYPYESPGGWNIIGQTPIKMFDVNRPVAALLQPGDSVQFYPITMQEFEHLKASQ